MLILLDCRPLQLAGPDSEKSRLLFSVAAALTRERGWQWLLLADKAHGPLPELPGETVIIKRALQGRIGWRLWYHRLIPRLAKKHKVDWVMLTGSAAGATPMPRIATVFCFSGGDRLAARMKMPADKVVILHPSPEPTLAPLSMAQRENLKAEFAQGKEYFFADATAAREPEVIHLLKAFSLFKKRQLSNLQLIVMGNAAEGMQEKLDTYKYREAVHWCPPAGNAGRDRLITGAYAFLFLFEGDSLGTPLLNAWKAGVPVLLTAGSRLQEMAGDAAIYADGKDDAALAASLMSVYKDETLRSRLIQMGLSRVAEYGIDKPIAAIREAIGKNS